MAQMQNAQSVALQLEKVRDKLPLLYERDDILLTMIQQRGARSGYLNLIPSRWSVKVVVPDPICLKGIACRDRQRGIRVACLTAAASSSSLCDARGMLG